MEVKNFFVYVLVLEHGKYYVGGTFDLGKRLQQHIDGNGSEWTKIHNPIGTLKIMENCSPSDEEKVTLDMMAKFGIDNVRGGSHCQIELQEDEFNYIQKQIRGFIGACFRCGEIGHFIKNCPIAQYHHSKQSSLEERPICPFLKLLLDWIGNDIRVFLSVPFERKEEAKALGARWDREKKKWYAPDNTYVQLISTFPLAK